MIEVVRAPRVTKLQRLVGSDFLRVLAGAGTAVAQTTNIMPNGGFVNAAKDRLEVFAQLQQTQTARG